ncbi:hypothetical protein DVH24_011282 [Malus domestica]|uniref:Uncharacterized protein n=1 Tax=Malus domestica TaxID=3750 RepID=A0A498JVI2_MALDO|nr:hypothetical protein DVH24_011282 [Malus domestica]
MMNLLKKPKINSELSFETDKRPHLFQSLGQGEIMNSHRLYKKQSALNSVRGNRHCFGGGGGSDEIINSSEASKRELLLFKDSENCFSGTGIAFNAKEESQTNLDLFLHLKAKKHVGVHCFYCKRVLQNRQALGGHLGHLRVHKEEINAKRS